MVVDIWKDTDQIVEDLPNERKYSFKSGVNIMFGCNNFCSYCIVPYVRGRERSREPKDIIREIEVTGGRWRGGSHAAWTECQFLRKESGTPNQLCRAASGKSKKIEGLERIRFMTSHPKDLSDELIACYGTVKEDLPSSASAAAVRQQPYSEVDEPSIYQRISILTLVESIREGCPDIALTTDIIVGFPGETEEDF